MLKILYVDDEIHNLQTFKANFRFEYNILTALNTEEAFDILNNNPDIRIVFSDNKMPVKCGIEFFKELKELYPNIVRILISAYSDKETIIDSINKCHVFQFVEKPIFDKEISDIIEKANEYYLTKINKKIIPTKLETGCKVDIEEREELVDKLFIINNLIRKGYNYTYEKLNTKYIPYILSIRNNNYFSIKENIISRLSSIAV